MTENAFSYDLEETDDLELINGVIGEKTIFLEKMFVWKWLVTDDGKGWYNIYVLDEDMVMKPINQLDSQLPKDDVDKDESWSWKKLLIECEVRRLIWKTFYPLDIEIGKIIIEDRDMEDKPVKF